MASLFGRDNLPAPDRAPETGAQDPQAEMLLTGQQLAAQSNDGNEQAGRHDGSDARGMHALDRCRRAALRPQLLGRSPRGRRVCPPQSDVPRFGQRPNSDPKTQLSADFPQLSDF